MHRVLIVGAGKIGPLIAVLLASTKDYEVHLADINIESSYLTRIIAKVPTIKLVQLDATDNEQVKNFLQKNSMQTIVSSLPYYCNIAIAKLAKEFNLNYFDLTEDVRTATTVADLANYVKGVMVPQCGLAPGFISVVANDLMKRFSAIDTVKMRVGALPINISNALQYALTWSTDGLINEYGNLCHAIEHGQAVMVPALEGLEQIEIDGLSYEAFNTSGGAGTLIHSYLGQVRQLNYKTIRYPGHCEKMRFLMNDLNLNEDRDTLKNILEHALPKTAQDVVLVYVSVTGTQDNQFCEENYVKKFYPKVIHDLPWSAIQLTTASELCAVLDIVVQQPNQYQGLVTQEQFTLAKLTHNRFGQYYA